MKRTYAITITALLLFAAYERGYRIASLEEIPESKRATSVFVMAGAL